MTNEYYAKPTELSPGSMARSANINIISQAVEAGFDSLPPGLSVVMSEIVDARDGRDSLLLKNKSQDMAIAAITAGSGVKATLNDQTIGTLSSKLISTDSSILFSTVSPGGDEQINISAPNSLYIESRTTNTVLGIADRNKIVVTSGTFTQTFSPAATLGAGWFCYIKNSDAGNITIDPYVSELIDGLDSYIMYPGECRLFQCNGTTIQSIVINSFYAVFTASGTSFVKPPGYQFFEGLIWGGGGGGGKAPTGSSAAAGGGGGGCTPFQLNSSLFSSSETVSIAAGGNPASVANGNLGGNSTIGSLVTGYGGGGGGGTTQNGTYCGGGGGGGMLGAGMTANGVTAGVGGLPTIIGLVSSAGGMNGVLSGSDNTNGVRNIYGGGGGCNGGGNGGIPVLWGGGGGGGTYTSALATGAQSIYGKGHGGNGSTSTGYPGTAPGGGGGGGTLNGGAGARGELRIWGAI